MSEIKDALFGTADAKSVGDATASEIKSALFGAADKASVEAAIASQGGGSSVLDDLIEGKSGIHLVSNAESVAGCAFESIDHMHGNRAGLGQYLESVDLPNATSIGDKAFANCYDLTSIDLPNATSIGGAAFLGCSALASISLPNATSIGASAFASCSALTSVNLPNATSIGVSAFTDISPTAVINIGAAEGEITGAPWGAPEGVTINYNVK